MKSKILTWTLLTLFIFAVICIIYALSGKKGKLGETKIKQMKEIAQTEQDKFSEITDECIDEWEEYVSEKIEEASNQVIEDNTHYILKDILGYIEVYCLDENNQEYLYKKTNIPTVYLAQEDIENLKKGIEVVGAEEMNKMLEDFE